jgi:DNA polymerase-4
MKTKLSTNNLISTESIIHCDLDSFFASVEQALRPELHGKPVAVSAARGQGVITAATYEAKRAGVRVGMPYFKAKKLLPSLIFVEARMEAYHRAGDLLAPELKSSHLG